jgi:2,4-dienoyl-CoA reductase (NADPH2)
MSSSAPFKHLLAPGRIGSIETRNRIVMAPMGTNLAEGNGYAGERIKRYYEERARGGVGLIIVGVGAIAYPAGACIPNQVAISSDEFLPGLKELTERVHAHDAKIAIQLQHAGKVATQDMRVGRPLWVPSVPALAAGDLFDDATPQEVQAMTAYLTKPGAGVSFYEMTVQDIAQLIDRFAEAAARAQRAGFDGVEIHAAHGYLISSFLSPASNKRTDAYGGSLENRARLLVEVIRAAKSAAGEDFPVWCRLDATEFRIPNGITIEDAEKTAEIAERVGADAIHVSAYAEPTSGIAFTEAPLVHQPRGYVAFAERIKRRLRIPVIAVGRIEPSEADAMIGEGKADFVAMARKLLADPELPKKLREGRADEIRPCIYCYTCVGKIYLGEPTCCAVNPATGRERGFEIGAARRRRRVLIAGAGPAGMEAARVAALRGHRVTLCERTKQLGGALRFAALLYEENAKLLDYFETQVKKLPIDVRLEEQVTPTLVRQLQPDVVLVAVGARRVLPQIPGIDAPHVLSGDDLRSLFAGDQAVSGAQKLSAAQRAMLKAGRMLGLSEDIELTREMTRRWMPLGRRVAIIGGGLVGIELAEFLSARGRDVTVLEERQTLAAEMALPRRWRALHTLRGRGVRLLTGVRIDAIVGEEIRYSSTGKQETVAADHVIIASGACEDRSLADALSGLGVETHLIGDCRSLAYIEGALIDAARVAQRI